MYFKYRIAVNAKALSILVCLLIGTGITIFSQEKGKEQIKENTGPKEKTSLTSAKQTSEQIIPLQYGEKIKWYSIEEVEKMVRTKPKKILIDVYTDWCGWCKKMDASTFPNPAITSYVNENFYAVKFNAETADTINFHGGKYINLSKSGRSTHPLALSLLGWRVSYPTIVYLTEALEYIGPVPGYQTPEQLEVILTYMAKEKYRTMSLDDFQKTFVGTVKPK
jgi:thioredoxin-related protein